MMPMKSFYKRLLVIIVWLCEKVLAEEPCEYRTVGFRQVRIGGITVEGDNLMSFKTEVGGAVTLVAGNFKDRNGNPAEIEAGSASVVVTATDSDGNDVTESVSFEQNPENELEVTLKHTGTEECVASVTLRADGDPDADEEAPFIITGTVIFDSLNAVTGEFSVVGA